MGEIHDDQSCRHHAGAAGLKKQAETILQELGIPLSVAHDLFYRQIVTYRGLPFEIRLPNQTTIDAMEDAREGRGTRYDTIEDMFADMEE